ALAVKIDRVMRDLPALYRIVVVNDGSRDRTAEIAEQLREQYPMDVITHKYNRGLGETIRDGMEHIAEMASRGDVVVRMDCDDTHDPAYIPRMIEKMKEGYEVVTTSR